MRFITFFIKIIYVFARLIFILLKYCFSLVKHFINVIGHKLENTLETKSDFFFTKWFFQTYYIPLILLTNQLLVYLTDQYEWSQNKFFFFINNYLHVSNFSVLFYIVYDATWFFFLKILNFFDYDWDVFNLQVLPILFFKICLEVSISFEIVYGEIFYVYFIPFYRSFEFIDVEDDHEAMNTRSQQDK